MRVPRQLTAPAAVRNHPNRPAITHSNLPLWAFGGSERDGREAAARASVSRYGGITTAFHMHSIPLVLSMSLPAGWRQRRGPQPCGRPRQPPAERRRHVHHDWRRQGRGPRPGGCTAGSQAYVEWLVPTAVHRAVACSPFRRRAVLHTCFCACCRLAELTAVHCGLLCTVACYALCCRAVGRPRAPHPAGKQLTTKLQLRTLCACPPSVLTLTPSSLPPPLCRCATFSACRRAQR